MSLVSVETSTVENAYTLDGTAPSRPRLTARRFTCPEAAWRWLAWVFLTWGCRRSATSWRTCGESRGSQRRRSSWTSILVSGELSASPDASAVNGRRASKASGKCSLLALYEPTDIRPFAKRLPPRDSARRHSHADLEAAGAAGVHIEDQVTAKRCGHRPGKALVPTGEMVSRLSAAVGARSDADFLIMARTDAFAVEGARAVSEGRFQTYCPFFRSRS